MGSPHEDYRNGRRGDQGQGAESQDSPQTGRGQRMRSGDRTDGWRQDDKGRDPGASGNWGAYRQGDDLPGWQYEQDRGARFQGDYTPSSGPTEVGPSETEKTDDRSHNERVDGPGNSDPKPL